MRVGRLNMQYCAHVDGSCTLRCHDTVGSSSMPCPDGWPKASPGYARVHPPELPPVLNATTRYDDNDVEKAFRRACDAAAAQLRLAWYVKKQRKHA